MKDFTIKKYLNNILICLLFLNFFKVNIVIASTIYENKTEDIISKGVKYENIRKITDEGFLNINVIRVNIKNENIKILPVQSEIYGKKETTTKLLENKGAIAGINADYFDTSTNNTTSMGNVVCDGKIVSISREENGYATFFIDNKNNHFIEYLKPKIIFKNNGEININVQAINKYYKDFNAIYFDRQAIKDTTILDNKFKDLVKFVVKDNVITYISEGGEVVEIPENGFIIVAAATYAQYFYDSVKVGDNVEIYIEEKFDFNKIKTAIGGAGKIIENGSYSNYGYVVKPNERNPRSAIGINKDNTEVILVTVDGRGSSIGATHKEMAEILISLGAYNAMHLDGGGSTTMAVKKINSDKIKTVNFFSDKKEREIINAIGIFNNAPLGKLESLSIETENDKVFLGSFINVDTFGLDENLNKIDISDNITYSCNENEGIWENNIFYPKKVGNINIKASHKELTRTKNIECLKLANLYSELDYIETSKGNSVELKIKGVNEEGIEAQILGIKYEVFPSNLGIVEKDHFKAKENGSGYIKATLDEVSIFIPVNIGLEEKLITSFLNNDKIYFESSSETIKGTVDYKNINNQKVLNLNYEFIEDGNIQSAYIIFKDKIKFENDSSGIKISIYGDKSNNLLRGKFIDSKGIEFIIDISDKIDWEGFKDIEVYFPKNISFPIKLESIYIVSLNNSSFKGSIYIKNLISLCKMKKNNINIPKNNIKKNYLYANLEDEPQKNSFDITFVGDIVLKNNKKPNNYKDIQDIIISKFSKNSSLGVFFLDTDINNLKINTKNWSKSYKFELFNNVGLISLNNLSGSLTSTSVYNWRFINEAKNSKVDHIIIQVNKNPNLMKSKIDLDMFKLGLKEIKNSGKNIFVIYQDSLNTNDVLQDGITYINLGDLFKKNGEINNDFSILRFRITDNNIKFDIKKVFKNS